MGGPRGPAQPRPCCLRPPRPLPWRAHPLPGPQGPRVTALLCPCRIGSYCRSKGWQRIQDSRREDYTLKWCEVKCRDNYHSFREGSRGGATGSGLQLREPPGPEPDAKRGHRPPCGEAEAVVGGRGGLGSLAPQRRVPAGTLPTPGEQLLYQIPNNKLLTTKIGLLGALREYSRVVNKSHKTSSLCAQAK